MKNSWIYLLPVIYSVLVGLSSCRSERKEVPDVQDLAVTTKVVSFVQLLAEASTSSDPLALQQLTEQYPAFSQVYFTQVLGINPFDPRTFKDSLPGWLSSPFMQGLQHAVDSVYGDFSTWSAEFEQSFKYMKHYFPDQTTPAVYTYNSEMGVANMIFEDQGKDALGVGLEFYLQGVIPYKEIDPMNPNFSDYVVRTYNADHLVKKALESWVEDQVSPVAAQQMLDYMIRHGKKLFILEKLLPSTQDTVIFEYTPTQLAWCRDNEAQIWAYFLQEKMIYEKEMRKVQRYVFPAPVSAGMPDGAPGRTGDFIGYKIVQAYMTRHPQTSLQDLAVQTDAQAIMDGARYRP